MQSFPFDVSNFVRFSSEYSGLFRIHRYNTVIKISLHSEWKENLSALFPNNAAAVGTHHCKSCEGTSFHSRNKLFEHLKVVHGNGASSCSNVDEPLSATWTGTTFTACKEDVREILSEAKSAIEGCKDRAGGGDKGVPVTWLTMDKRIKPRLRVYLRNLTWVQYPPEDRCEFETPGWWTRAAVELLHLLSGAGSKVFEVVSNIPVPERDTSDSGDRTPRPSTTPHIATLPGLAHVSVRSLSAQSSFMCVLIRHHSGSLINLHLMTRLRVSLCTNTNAPQGGAITATGGSGDLLRDVRVRVRPQYICAHSLASAPTPGPGSALQAALATHGHRPRPPLPDDSGEAPHGDANVLELEAGGGAERVDDGRSTNVETQVKKIWTGSAGKEEGVGVGVGVGEGEGEGEGNAEDVVGGLGVDVGEGVPEGAFFALLRVRVLAMIRGGRVSLSRILADKAIQRALHLRPRPNTNNTNTSTHPASTANRRSCVSVEDVLTACPELSLRPLGRPGDPHPQHPQQLAPDAGDEGEKNTRWKKAKDKGNGKGKARGRDKDIMLWLTSAATVGSHPSDLATMRADAIVSQSSGHMNSIFSKASTENIPSISRSGDEFALNVVTVTPHTLVVCKPAGQSMETLMEQVRGLCIRRQCHAIGQATTKDDQGLWPSQSRQPSILFA